MTSNVTAVLLMLIVTAGGVALAWVSKGTFMFPGVVAAAFAVIGVCLPIARSIADNVDEPTDR